MTRIIALLGLGLFAFISIATPILYAMPPDPFAAVLYCAGFAALALPLIVAVTRQATQFDKEPTK